jgi:hypothetical protein
MRGSVVFCMNIYLPDSISGTTYPKPNPLCTETMESICREQGSLKGSKCSFSYIKADEYETEKPCYHSSPLPPEGGHLRTNIMCSAVDGITVVDVRDVQNQLSIDNQGFEYFDAPANLTDAALSGKGLEAYLKEITSSL